MRLFSILISLALLCGSAAADNDMCFLRGDANGDGSVNVADVTTLYQYIGQQSPTLHDNLDALDANDDGSINVADPVYLWNILFNSYSCAAPNADTGAGFDWTDDEVNGDPDIWDFLDGDYTWTFDRSTYLWLVEGTGIAQWYQKLTPSTYTESGGADTFRGLKFEVRNTFKYVRTGNKWDLTNKPKISSPAPIPFFWASFSEADCACRNAVQVKWKTEHSVAGVTGTGVYNGRTIIESDAHSVLLELKLKNTTKDEHTTCRATVDMGHIGIVLECFGSTTLYEDTDATEYSGWDNSAGTHQQTFTGTINFTLEDLYGSNHNDWDEDDAIVVDDVHAADGVLRHIISSGKQDATEDDAAIIKVGLTTPRFEHLEE